ncbi:MAG: hypothetical protein CMK56_05205 [Proteobacteria bacterium]|nr:hypothetical protein [Pseudomonadota bacterium]
MKISLTNIGDKNYITDYGSNFVSINNTRYRGNLIITPDSVDDTWNNSPPFSVESIKFLSFLDVEILIIGTGLKHQVLSPATIQPLIEKPLSFEIMSTPAACRTFNILVAEDRNIGAALLI